MKTVTVASAKGGTGKSTIAALLAVRASQDTPRVAMMDLNFDQGSLTQWWRMRGEPDSPRLVDEEDIENIPRDVKKLASAYDWLFIDTPPFDMDVIEQAIAVADAVVIPVKAGFFDIMASQAVVEMCQERKKPFSLLLNAFDSSHKILGKQAEVAFVDVGPLFATRIEHRAAYIQALSSGKTGAETNKAAKLEVDGLWSEVKRLLSGKGRSQ
jgi:chromosome partitioning protein